MNLPTYNTVPPSQWIHSLYGCLGDVGLCCEVCWVPWIPYGKYAARVRGQEMGTAQLRFICLEGVESARTRSALRYRYNLPEDPCSDRMVAGACTQCALCQEIRELNTREGAGGGGVAPTWPAMAPPPAQQMAPGQQPAPQAYPPPPYVPYPPQPQYPPQYSQPQYNQPQYQPQYPPQPYGAYPQQPSYSYPGQRSAGADGAAPAPSPATA